MHFSTNVKEFYAYILPTQNHAYEAFLISLIVLLKQTIYKNSEYDQEIPQS